MPRSRLSRGGPKRHIALATDDARQARIAEYAARVAVEQPRFAAASTGRGPGPEGLRRRLVTARYLSRIGTASTREIAHVLGLDVDTVRSFLVKTRWFRRTAPGQYCLTPAGWRQLEAHETAPKPKPKGKKR